MCIGPLKNTSCQRIVFAEEYAHPEARGRWIEGPGEPRTNYFSREWERVLMVAPSAQYWGYGRTWVHLPIKPDDPYDTAAEAIIKVDPSLSFETLERLREALEVARTSEAADGVVKPNP
jgi:hypothetical protein